MQKLDITLKPYKAFILMILLIIFSAWLILALVPLPTEIRFLLYSLSALYGLEMIYSDGLLKSPDSILRIQTTTEGRWLLHLKTGIVAGTLQKDSWITRWLCVLRFKDNQASLKKSCLVFRNATHSAQYRQLMIQLRCNPGDKTD